MADKPKMSGEMKKSWGSEIINSIYDTVSGNGSPEYQEKIRKSEKQRVNRDASSEKAAGFVKGFSK